MVLTIVIVSHQRVFLCVYILYRVFLGMRRVRPKSLFFRRIDRIEEHYKRNQSDVRQIYHHATCATDSRNVEVGFSFLSLCFPVVVLSKLPFLFSLVIMQSAGRVQLVQGHHHEEEHGGHGHVRRAGRPTKATAASAGIFPTVAPIMSDAVNEVRFVVRNDSTRDAEPQLVFDSFIADRGEERGCHV